MRMQCASVRVCSVYMCTQSWCPEMDGISPSYTMAAMCMCQGSMLRYCLLRWNLMRAVSVPILVTAIVTYGAPP